MDRTIDEFIIRSQSLDEVEPLCALFAEAMGRFGFSATAYMGFRVGGQTLDPPFARTTYGAGWTKRYWEQGYHTIDPVVTGSFRSSMPFTWGTAHRLARLTAPQRRVFHEAAEFGLPRGATIPVHGYGGEFAAVSVATAESDTEFERSWAENRHIIHVMSLHFHHRVAERLNAQRQTATVPVLLSKREAECLTWVARGKTTWETSEILHLSEKTVEAYLEAAKRKLGVYSRPQAVVKAVMQGLITP